MVNILVIDNHKLVRASLCRLLDEVDGFNIIGEANCAPDALKHEITEQPDIIVMDLNLPNVESILCIRRLQQRFNNAGIVVVSSASTHLLPIRLFKSGVGAFISKKAQSDELVTAIQTVYQGDNGYLSMDLIASFEDNSIPGRKELRSLSTRELQITFMLAEGKQTKKISQILCLSPKTINTYRYRIYDKLGLNGAVDFARFAISQGIIDEPLSMTN